MKNADLATQWRFKTKHIGKGGVVIIYDGQIAGWTSTLREPEKWEPGVIAVTEQGEQYLAEGGSSYNGAKKWAKI